MPHTLRRRRKIVAALNLPRPESVETEIEKEASRFRKRGGKETQLRSPKLVWASLSWIDALNRLPVQR